MKTSHRQNFRAIALFGAVALSAYVAPAAEIGHFAPGVVNIRDYTVPDPGYYGVLYNYWYSTDRLNDRNGNKADSVTINPRGGPGVTLDVDVDVDLYATSPVFLWVSNWKVLGAKYAAYVAPSFATSSVGASLATASGRGVDGSVDSDFGVGDLFVQPVWLGWSVTNWDFALGYGFYAPVGRYETESTTLPVGGPPLIGPLTVEAVDNIGLGFWEHQFQGAITWYPWADKRMAVATALTYGIPQEKEDFDLTPGQSLTLNWGISQYLPLKQDHTLLLEVGPAGYSSWQITDDSGSDARNPSVHDEVHAVGGQIGVTYLPWTLLLNFHAFYEFSSTDRFQGESFGFNITKKF